VDPKFAAVVESLQPALDRLKSMQPLVSPLPIRVRGVYLFSEGGRHLYVGRSNNIGQRLRQHRQPSSQHNQAVFAFKLAREKTGKVVASYRVGPNGRAGLIGDPEFSEAFNRAKARVRAMEVRYVEEDDQTRQALLELYCAIALG
jgi:hypothetical protein